MRKLTTLTAIFSFIGIGIFFLASTSNAQSVPDLHKTIEEGNLKYVEWFNKGDVDSIVAFYGEDACLVAKGCGKDFIRQHLNSEVGKYKF